MTLFQLKTWLSATDSLIFVGFVQFFFFKRREWDEFTEEIFDDTISERLIWVQVLDIIMQCASSMANRLLINFLVIFGIKSNVHGKFMFRICLFTLVQFITVSVGQYGSTPKISHTINKPELFIWNSSSIDKQTERNKKKLTWNKTN